jgi:enoyl-CoA hydratase/carnithine racemase
LINRRLSAEILTEETMALAAKIASKSTMTVATGKRAFYEQAEMPLDEAYAYSSKVMVDNMLKHDAKEGIGAFIEKRTPDWQDR